MFTVKKLLQIPEFSEFKILAGMNGLDNEIASVNLMDNPNALDWFSPRELLLTSGYFFKDSQEEQDKVVRYLKSMNCPALCIKPRQYLQSIPQNIITLADQLSLPVIEIPFGMSFSKISYAIWEQISGNYNILNKKSLDIHKEFFRISLYGGGLDKISQSLSAMVSNPVIFLDQSFNVINWTDMEENPYPINDYLRQNTSKMILNDNYINSLPMDFELLQRPLMRPLHIEDATINTSILPVYIQNIHYGYILIWATVKTALSEIDYIALEYGVMPFGLELIRVNEINKAKHRVRKDFFNDLLAGKITDMDNLRYLCDIHNISMNLFYTPIVFHLDFFGHEEYDLVDKKRYEDAKIIETLKLIDRFGANKPFIVYTLGIHGQIALFIGYQNDILKADPHNSKKLCQEIINSLTKDIDGIKIYAGIGGTSEGIMDLHLYYKQASEALRLAQKNLGDNSIYHFEDFIVSFFLESNISNIEMRRYFDHTLGNLYKYDKENSSDLIKTLETWIENSYNTAQTARSLFAHRNTIIYRIEKISSILNSDLKNSDDLLKFQLALKIYRLLGL